MTFRIRRTLKARAELRAIFERIAADNVPAAHRLLDRIEEKLRLLADYPRLGRERPDVRPGARGVPVGAYLLLYRVDEDEKQVTPVRVFHSAQDMRDVFGD